MVNSSSITFVPDSIPADMRSLDQWVNWRVEIRDGKEAKVPLNPNRHPRAKCLKRASTSNPDSWGSLAQVIVNAEADDNLGIGFVFTEGDPYVGIDLDGCLDPTTSEFAEWANDIRQMIGASYEEISPSGTGTKIWVRNDGTLGASHKFELDTKICNRLPGVSKRPGFEIYAKERYFTVTGQTVNGCASEISEPETPLKVIVGAARQLARQPKDTFERRLTDEQYERIVSAGEELLYTGTDEELINEARQEDQRFRDLYDRGSTDAYAKDHSRADLALLYRLAYRCGPDPDRIERLFDESALARPDKWFDRKDYRDRSIRAAIAACGLDFSQGSIPLNEFFDVGGSLPPLNRGTQNRQSTAIERRPRRFRLERIDAIEPAPPDWVVRDYVAANATIVIHGPPESFKTFVAIDFGLCVASGREWAGNDVKQGPVVYICGEGYHGIKRRAQAWSQLNDTCLADVPFFVSTIAGDFQDPQRTTEVIDAIEEIARKYSAPVMVIVDTLARNYGGEENSNTEINAFFASLDEVRTRWECAVVVIHHPGHDNVQRPRGASAVLGNTDATGRLERVGPDVLGVKSMDVIYHPGKMKDAPPPGALGFTAKLIEIGEDERGQVIHSLALVPCERVVTGQETRDELRQRSLLREIARNPGESQKFYAEATGIPRTTVRNMAKKLMARRYIERDNRQKWQPTDRGSSYLDEWSDHDAEINKIVGLQAWNSQRLQ